MNKLQECLKTEKFWLVTLPFIGSLLYVLIKGNLASDGYKPLSYAIVFSSLLLSYSCFHLTFSTMNKPGNMGIIASYLLLVIGAFLGYIHGTYPLANNASFCSLYPWIPVVIACIIGLLVAKRRLLR